MSLDQKLIARCCHANFSRDVDKIEYAYVASEPLMNFHTQFVKECRKIRGPLFYDTPLQTECGNSYIVLIFFYFQPFRLSLHFDLQQSFLN